MVLHIGLTQTLPKQAREDDGPLSHLPDANCPNAQDASIHLTSLLLPREHIIRQERCYGLFFMYALRRNDCLALLCCAKVGADLFPDGTLGHFNRKDSDKMLYCKI